MIPNQVIGLIFPALLFFVVVGLAAVATGNLTSVSTGTGGICDRVGLLEAEASPEDGISLDEVNDIVSLEDEAMLDDGALLGKKIPPEEELLGRGILLDEDGPDRM